MASFTEFFMQNATLPGLRETWQNNSGRWNGWFNWTFIWAYLIAIAILIPIAIILLAECILSESCHHWFSPKIPKLPAQPSETDPFGDSHHKSHRLG